MADSINVVPINLVAVTPPVGLTTANFTELITAVAKYLRGTIQQNVSFFQTFAQPPTTFQGNLIYVSGIGNFMTWNTGTGQYDALNQLQIGNVIQQSVHYGDVTFDDVINGWIYLNGRNNADVAGLSASQLAALNVLYPNGTMPNVQPLDVFPTDIMAINGSVTSGAGFQDLETVTQTGTGATAKAYGAQGPASTNLIIIGLTGTPDNSGIWTGATSATVFTPLTTPYIYYGKYPIVSRVYVGTNIPSL